MCISLEKYYFLYNNIDAVNYMDITRVLLYQMSPILTGFKYLGFYIKPLGYRTDDWNWMIQKYEKKICLWTHKLLSMGGCLVLVQSVLSSIPVYWLGLAPIPASILHKLRSITFAFLWGSIKNNQRFHLVSCQNLSWPKEYEGWGIKNLHWFSITLRLKNIWRVLFNEVCGIVSSPLNP